MSYREGFAFVHLSSTRVLGRSTNYFSDVPSQKYFFSAFHLFFLILKTCPITLYINLLKVNYYYTCGLICTFQSTHEINRVSHFVSKMAGIITLERRHFCKGAAGTVNKRLHGKKHALDGNIGAII